MHGDRFFDTTRGKIVATLRRSPGASAFDLAREFGLSPNAIRQQLVILERDGLVAGRSVRRGKTKPTVEYALTSEAQKFFPQQYDRMLNAVLRELRGAGGDAAVEAVFAAMGKRTMERLNGRLADKPSDERIVELTAALRESGVDIDVEQTPTGYVIREHTCPYAKTVGEHPEVCSVIHSILHDVIGPTVIQTTSLATGGDECRFEVAGDRAGTRTA